MAMKPIFHIDLEGQMDRPLLDRFRKLLNLRPEGRLTDTEDGEFGHRSLRDITNEWVWLDLWRMDTGNARWTVRLTFAGPRPPETVVDRCRDEVLGAASALRLTVTSIRPAPAEPVPVAVQLKLPTLRALSARLAGGQRTLVWLSVDDRDTLQKVLHLKRELGGLTGTEFGWRYVHWDPSGGSLLLQLSDPADTGTEIALLYDRQPPREEVVTGCWLQVMVAAAEAGMTLTRLSPEPPLETEHDDWAENARHAADARSLREMLPMIGCSDDTVHEMIRGKLLMVTRQPEWRAAVPLLRRQVDDFLVGLTEDFVWYSIRTS